VCVSINHIVDLSVAAAAAAAAADVVAAADIDCRKVIGHNSSALEAL